MEIKDRIKSLRKKNSMTQSQLAEQVGVTLRCIQNYESGARYPRKNIIYKISEIFDVPYDYLASGVNDLESENQAQEFLKNAGLIFAGGKLSEDDKDKVMLALQKIYWEAKEINRQKEAETAKDKENKSKTSENNK
ncbi:MAG: helix-turn-helix transcriptional regulator [Oscillospiraceae bacterium]|nr:helix-turn-helix transcriptional regulator [Oscillospiraceae bacterium]